MVEIVCAIIGFVGVIVTVIASNNATRSKVTQTLEVQQAVNEATIANLTAELNEVKEDVKSHNHYAQLFNESAVRLAVRLDEQGKQIDEIWRKLDKM